MRYEYTKENQYRRIYCIPVDRFNKVVFRKKKQNIKLEIIKRESTTGTVWNDSVGWNQTKSLMESNTKQANFLQSRPAELPTEFYFTPVVPYFPPDYVIYLENGLPLTTEFNNPLQGL